MKYLGGEGTQHTAAQYPQLNGFKIKKIPQKLLNKKLEQFSIVLLSANY